MARKYARTIFELGPNMIKVASNYWKCENNVCFICGEYDMSEHTFHFEETNLKY